MRASNMASVGVWAMATLAVACTLAVAASAQATCVWALEEDVGAYGGDSVDVTTQLWVRWEDGPSANVSSKTSTSGPEQEDAAVPEPTPQMRKWVAGSKEGAAREGTLARTFDWSPNVEGACLMLTGVGLALLAGAMHAKRRMEG